MNVLVVLLGLVTATLLTGKVGGERKAGTRRGRVRGAASEEGRERAEARSDWYHPQITGVAAVTVKIRAYNATGELDILSDPFILGTRVLLTCTVTGLPEASEVLSYKWHHNCAKIVSSRCEIRDGDPYYGVEKDTLLVDVSSLEQGGRYYCTGTSLRESQIAITRELAVAG